MYRKTDGPDVQNLISGTPELAWLVSELTCSYTTVGLIIDHDVREPIRLNGRGARAPEILILANP